MMEQKQCSAELALVYYHTGPGVDLSSSNPMSDEAIAANYTMITRIRPEYKGKEPSDLFGKITQREYGVIAFAYYMGVSYEEAQKALG
ncbi:MAG: hypothetical protein H6767_05270 [Candidatus Peribacteria bacterium]|nr:MAG: hypothetical protein H6767_05270 [Candidatus Peribacteria bacterium]